MEVVTVVAEVEVMAAVTMTSIIIVAAAEEAAIMIISDLVLILSTVSNQISSAISESLIIYFM